MSLREAIKPFVPKLVLEARDRFVARARMRSNWIGRTSTPEDQHLTVYWRSDTQPRRQRVVEILARNIHDGDAVLEYGSHVGVNLKLLNDRFPSSRLYAVEPNREAFEFMREKLPFIQALNEEDGGFLRSEFPAEYIAVSFTCSVFFSMEPRRVRRVLRKMCQISTTVILAEGMANINGYRSRFPQICYLHPYSRWLRQCGFTIDGIFDTPDAVPQLDGILVARRAVSAPDSTRSAPGG
jgi:hypothetical protein